MNRPTIALLCALSLPLSACSTISSARTGISAGSALILVGTSLTVAGSVPDDVPDEVALAGGILTLIGTFVAWPSVASYAGLQEQSHYAVPNHTHRTPPPPPQALN